MNRCFFVSDIHGRKARWQSLFKMIFDESPLAVFIGGDIMPGFSAYKQRNEEHRDFLADYFVPNLRRMKQEMNGDYPAIFLILGNDDGRKVESAIKKIEEEELISYIHYRKVKFDGVDVYGYNYISPSPFRLKDWERYDVSRFTDVGCVSPEEGSYTVAIPDNEKKYRTIKTDLTELTDGQDMSKSVFLFHSPPYKSNLDRADLDGRMIDFTPVDVNVGSIAVRKFIETRQPLLTMHGHIHESARLTGSWRDKIGATECFSAAHDGPELAVIKFDLKDPTEAERVLV